MQTARHGRAFPQPTAIVMTVQGEDRHTTGKRTTKFANISTMLMLYRWLLGLVA